MKERDLPPTIPPPPQESETIVAWIAEVSGQPRHKVRSRLREEFAHPGINLVRAFRERGLRPHEWSEGLERFYAETDAYLYELVGWNRNGIKQRMRRWMGEHLADGEGRALEVLTVGDGLGFDSVYLAHAGHHVTYFEIPGCSVSFARRLFAESPGDVNVRTDENDIPHGAFDVAVCLDVLEHLRDPRALVKNMCRWLGPGGRLIVHAPFQMTLSAYPTHLKSNRRYCGSLSLYEEQDLTLVDGAAGWNPIVLRKRRDGSPRGRPLSWKMLRLRLMGQYLTLGRFSPVPFLWMHVYRHLANKPFEA